MKYWIYLFACCFFASCQQATPPQKHQDQPQDTSSKVVLPPTEPNMTTLPVNVDEIKQVYNLTIAKLQTKALDSTVHQYNCANERSGTITYFSENGKVLIIKHKYSEYDHHTASDQYFISNDSLYFVHFNRVSWSFETGKAVEGATKDDITEQRIYIVKGKAVLCLEKKYSVHSEDTTPPVPSTIANQQIKYGSLAPLVHGFNQLVAFKQNPKQTCLEK